MNPAIEEALLTLNRVSVARRGLTRGELLRVLENCMHSFSEGADAATEVFDQGYALGSYNALGMAMTLVCQLQNSQNQGGVR